MNNQALPVVLSQIETKLIFVGLAFSALVIPFSLGNSQLVTGAMVNTALFLSAVLLPERLFPPIIIFPSLGVLARSLIFGPLTPFLVFFAPFIWLANSSLILVFKRVLPSRGFFPSAFLASLVKAVILFSSAKFFFRLNLVPDLFLTAMGVNQLITAWLGGLGAFFLLQRLNNGRKI